MPKSTSNQIIHLRAWLYGIAAPACRPRRTEKRKVTEGRIEREVEVQMVNNLGTTSPNREIVNCKQCLAKTPA